jgi:predicted nucleic acid-binding protein
LTLYLDTSVLVAALTIEPETERVQAWLERQADVSLSISLWVTAEFSSALSLKQRMRQLDADERADALAAFTRMTAATFTVLPISELHFHAAARLIDRSAAALRTPDALHLAVSSGHSETLCTLDRPLAEAGAALGIKATLI